MREPHWMTTGKLVNHPTIEARRLTCAFGFGAVFVSGSLVKTANRAHPLNLGALLQHLDRVDVEFSPILEADTVVSYQPGGIAILTVVDGVTVVCKDTEFEEVVGYLGLKLKSHRNDDNVPRLG